MVNNDIIPEFDNETNENLTITLQNAPNIEGGLIVALSGYIDTYNSTFFQERVQRLIEAGFVRLIFDCGALNHVSSTGIGSLSACLKTVKPRNGDLVMLNLQPKVYEVLQVLGFSQFFNVKNTLDESLQFFYGGADGQNPGAFPALFSCPACSKNLKAVKPGRFRCSGCESIIAVDNMGAASLG
ncbi:MAG: STAS domain-containing protein [Treponema sp.]|nr:STAS domain-containing protein [Treponema sp.]